MTPREIVERAITFRRPPRLPLKFDVVGVNDCYDVWTHDPTGWTWSFQGRMPDEWGCVWRRTEADNTGQVVEHPLDDWSRLADYCWPDPDAPARYSDFERQLAGAGDRFVMFCFGHGIFERFHMLRGMTGALTDFYLEPQRAHEVIERILDHHLRVFRRVVRLGGPRIHAAALADDWGMQDRAFLSPQIFREFYKPRYKRWFDEIKAAGMHPWIHSCGHINEVLDDLIECGLEVVNPQQPETVGIDEIGRRFRGRICFESIVDTQKTLPRGTYDEIRSQARRLVDAWGTPDGGFIASDYNDAAAIGVTFDRRLVMFQAFAEKGGYPDYERVLAQARAPRTGHSCSRQADAAPPPEDKP